MKPTKLDLRDQLDLIDWREEEIFNLMHILTGFDESHLAFALVVSNFIELEDSQFDTVTKKFLSAMEKSIEDLKKYSSLKVPSPRVLH